MYKFEKILKDNSIVETDPELPKAITNEISKFRKIEAKIAADPDAEEDNDKLEMDLLILDKKIYALIEENFDIEDEEAEEEKRKLAEAEQAKKNKLAAEKEAAAKAEEKKREAAAQLKKEQAAEEAKKAAEEEQAREDAKPATTDFGALEKLFKRGKKVVTMMELKTAGFNIGWTSRLNSNGCTIQEYKLYRSDPFSTEFTLTKIG